MRQLKTYFITGLVILLPLAVTLMILSFVINFLTQPFMGVISSILEHFHLADDGLFFLSPEQVLRYLSKFLILVLLLGITLLIGMITKSLIIRTAFNIGDNLLHKIPLVNTVYKTTKDIIKTVFVSDKNSFKQVVMVPFPRKDVYAIGLISRDSPSTCSSAVGSDLVSVLIPTTPNPTTGFLLMFKREDLILIDMKPEDAIKYVVSCGVIVPDSPSIGEL